MTENKITPMDVVNKKIRNLILRHIKSEPETGWVESVSAVTFILKGLIHDSDADESVKKTIIQKIINIISQESK